MRSARRPPVGVVNKLWSTVDRSCTAKRTRVKAVLCVLDVCTCSTA